MAQLSSVLYPPTKSVSTHTFLYPPKIYEKILLLLALVPTLAMAWSKSHVPGSRDGRYVGGSDHYQLETEGEEATNSFIESVGCSDVGKVMKTIACQ